MKILDEINDKDIACSKGEPCAEPSGVAFSYILLMLYMVLVNVLLLNLLIAMFSSTFTLVQENTDKIWFALKCFTSLYLSLSKNNGFFQFEIKGNFKNIDWYSSILALLFFRRHSTT